MICESEGEQGKKVCFRLQWLIYREKRKAAKSWDGSNPGQASVAGNMMYNVACKVNEGTHVGTCDEVTNFGGCAVSRCVLYCTKARLYGAAECSSVKQSLKRSYEIG